MRHSYDIGVKPLDRIYDYYNNKLWIDLSYAELIDTKGYYDIAQFNDNIYIVDTREAYGIDTNEENETKDNFKELIEPIIINNHKYYLIDPPEYYGELNKYRYIDVIVSQDNTKIVQLVIKEPYLDYNVIMKDYNEDEEEEIITNFLSDKQIDYNKYWLLFQTRDMVDFVVCELLYSSSLAIKTRLYEIMKLENYITKDFLKAIIKNIVDISDLQRHVLIILIFEMRNEYENNEYYKDFEQRVYAINKNYGL